MFLKILIIFLLLNLHQFEYNEQCEIFYTISSVSILCDSVDVEKNMLNFDSIYIDLLKLVNVSSIGINSFKNLNISVLEIINSNLKSVSTSSFNQVKNINKIKLDNVQNMEKILNEKTLSPIYNSNLLVEVFFDPNQYKIINLEINHQLNIDLIINDFNSPILYLLFNKINNVILNINQNLKELYIFGNNIKSLTIKENNINCSQLSIIDLSENGIEEIDLPFLINLEYIILVKNNLKQIKKETFSKLNKLKRISLNINKIKHIDEFSFSNLINLDILDLAHNQLDQDFRLSNLTNAYLALSSNFFPEFTSKNLDNSNKIKSLDLTNCSIEYFELNLDNLESIYLAFNKIKYINKIGLNYFHFSSDKINVLDSYKSDKQSDFNETKSFLLDLQHNDINYFSEHVFCFNNFHKFKIFQLYLNNFNSMNKCLIKQLKNLTHNIFFSSIEEIDCDLRLIAKKYNFNMNEKDNDYCSKFKLVDDCSDEYNLRYDCNYNIDEFKFETTWATANYYYDMLNKKVKSLESNQIVLLKSDYFVINLYQMVNKTNLKILLLDNLNQIIYSKYSHTIIYHKKSKTHILIKEEYEDNVILIRGTRFFYSKSSGLLNYGNSSNIFKEINCSIQKKNCYEFIFSNNNNTFENLNFLKSKLESTDCFIINQSYTIENSFSEFYGEYSNLSPIQRLNYFLMFYFFHFLIILVLNC